MKVEIKGKEYPVLFNWLTVKLWEEATTKNAFQTFLDGDYQRSAGDVLEFIFAGFKSAALREGTEFTLSLNDVASCMDFGSSKIFQLMKHMNDSLGAGLDTEADPKKPEAMNQAV